jgi:hypothetical protein
MVVPRGVLPRRVYHAAAIAWILARIGLQGATTTTVREEVCPFKTIGLSAADRWLAPVRFLIALQKGLLFAGLGRFPAELPRKQLAARAAMQLAALAPPSFGRNASPLTAWHGAALFA